MSITAGGLSHSSSRSVASKSSTHTLNSNRTTDSAHYRHNLKVEHEASKIIDEKLPKFFGVKATKQQVSMVHGRHPKSLPRDSELWIYNKISAERRSRIKKGHEFWKVLSETNLEAVASDALNEKDRNRNVQGNSLKVDTKIDKTDDVHNVLKGSIKKQLNSLDATMDNLDIKVDFVHQNQINYGMTFMIMNYANEVLYVDKNGQLRAKPITFVQPYDRVKFKMIDLINPSNPSALEFGDNLWIQCLDISENADNSFTAGTVLTTKLYEPPELASVQFEENFSSTSSGLVINKPIGKKKDEYEQQVINLEREKEERLAQIQKEKKEKKERLLRRSQDLSEQLYKLAKRFPTTTKSMMILDEDKEDVGKALHELIDEEELLKRSFDEADDGISTTYYESKELSEFNSRKRDQLERMAKETTQKASNEVHRRDHKTVDNTKVAEICGQINVNRIVEMRKNDAYVADANMTDEKASRYNSKQSLNLGKWTVHSAYRPDLRVDSRQGPNKVRHTASSAAAAGESNHMHPGFLYSITPIIIQQDQYCLSTAHPDEYHHWPPTSTYIIHNSSHISPDLAAEYEKNYTKLSSTTSSTSQQEANKIAAKLANAITVPVTSSSVAFPPVPKVEEISSSGFNPSDGQTPEENKSGRLEEAAAMDTSNLSFKPNLALHNTPVANNDDYACLRKIVLRGPPYDFAVDRKCVWKICLFEQFSENYMQLSTKEKQATKLMENATMALKLSKMNREGARVHMPSNATEQLPALVGGEKFPRTLREITFKTSLKAQNQYFRDRRIRELKLQEYFQHRINHHIQNLDPDSPVGSRSPSRSREFHSSSSFLTEDGEGIAMRGLSGFYGTSMTSPPMSPYTNATTPIARTSSGGDNLGSCLDDSSIDSFDDGYGSRRKSMHASRSGRRGSLDSSDSLGSGSVDDGSKQMKTNVSTPLLPSEVSLRRSTSSEGNLPYLTPKVDLSDDVKRIFNLKDYRRDKSLMVLNNSDAIKNFKTLSVGEQVLSLHKTMNHLNRVAERKTLGKVPQHNSYSKPKAINPNVLRKMEILQQEDKVIDKILDVKEVLKKRRETMEFDELSNSGI